MLRLIRPFGKQKKSEKQKYFASSLGRLRANFSEPADADAIEFHSWRRLLRREPQPELSKAAMPAYLIVQATITDEPRFQTYREAKIAAFVEAGFGSVQAGGGYDVPMPAIIGSGRKP